MESDIQLDVSDFLLTYFSPHASSVTFLASGMFSQAFSFEADGREYIFRLNAFEVDFRKSDF